MGISQLCEFFMLFAFGFSWPFAIARTYRAKRVDGKSPMFMAIVLVGYVCGIMARILDVVGFTIYDLRFAIAFGNLGIWPFAVAIYPPNEVSRASGR